MTKKIKFFLTSVLVLLSCTANTLGFAASKPDEPVGSPIAQISPSQQRAIQRELSSKTGNNAVLRAREEAKDTIEKVLALSSCYPNWDISRYLAAYAVEGTGFYAAPMARMQYHPKSQCLTVKRLDNWKMLAKNVLSFRAIYVSDASAESSSVIYQFLKDAGGTWLLKTN